MDEYKDEQLSNEINKFTEKPINSLFKTSKQTLEEEQERLSSDLANFISNPSLTAKLTDGSLDLASYSAVVDNELSSLEKECIDIYKEHAGDIQVLREEISMCDGVLASLQEMLLGFQADLGGLSGDIRTLQDQSKTLGTKLRNRRDAETGLRRFLQNVVIPPTVAEVICYAEVDATFMSCVEEINAKYAYVREEEDVGSSSGIPPRDTIAGKEMVVLIEKLRYMAIQRIRNYFLNKIAELRTPKTNVRMIQVNSLLKYAALNDFLHDAAPDVYNEVRDVYMESMAKILHALFRTYQAQLARLDAKAATRNDLIAVEDAALRDVFSTKVNLNKRGDAFFLGSRVDILDIDRSDHTRPIMAHMALAEGEKYPYEVLFNSLMHHLMDSATNEYIFTRLFFKETGQEAFNVVFNKTLSLLLEQIENYLFNCYDCLGILLMIKLTHANRRIMKRRNINVLDGFFDKITILLWPRLKIIMDAQLRSVRTANAKKLGGVEFHAHYFARRYAEFTSSVLLILNKGKRATTIKEQPMKRNVSSEQLPKSSYHSKQPSLRSIELETNNSQHPSTTSEQNELQFNTYRGTAGDLLLGDLSHLTEESILLLERLADTHNHKDKKLKIVFLINNLDSIVTIFQERRTLGKEMKRFADLLAQEREMFVEEELYEHFGSLISFVQQSETTLASLSTITSTSINANTVATLVQEFSNSWKVGIEQMNKNVLSYFSNFRNGMEILKQVLTQLLLYYTRFQDILKKVWRKSPQPAFMRELVGTSVILAEIKKYALAI